MGETRAAHPCFLEVRRRSGNARKSVQNLSCSMALFRVGFSPEGQPGKKDISHVRSRKSAKVRREPRHMSRGTSCVIGAFLQRKLRVWRPACLWRAQTGYSYICPLLGIGNWIGSLMMPTLF